MADALIWLAYFAIPVVLVYFARRRRDLPYRWMLWMFGAFIIACGTTHLMEVVNTYAPMYRLAGLIKVLTAAVSLATAVTLAPLVPKMLQLRGPAELQKEIDERMKAEQALRQAHDELERRVAERSAELEQRARELRSQTRLMESILNSIGEGVAVADINGKPLLFNPAAAKMIGIGVRDSRPAEWSRYPVFTADGQTPYPAHQLPLARAVRGEPTDDVELLVRNPARSEDTYVSVTGRPLGSDEGTVSGGVVVFRDITERKRGEEGLRASEARFRRVVEAAPNGMIMVDGTGTITLANAHLEKLFGYDQGELVGKPVEVLVPERFRARHPGHRAGFFADPQARAMGAGRDLFGRRQDGTEFPVEIGLNPLETLEGPFVLASIIDITERKQAEAALQLSEARFRRVVEAAPNGMIMVDGTGTITLANAHLEKLFGYDQGELVGKPVEVLVPERFRARHPGHRAGFFADPQARAMGAGRDLFGRRQDGTEFPVEIGLNPLETLEGPFVLASIIDITERKYHEKAMRRSLEDKELLLKEIHHRVKNNLQIISTLLDLQSGHTSDPQALAMFKESRGRVRSMALIHARLYRSPDLARVDFAEYIRQLADDLYRTYKVSGDEIVLDVDVDVPPLPIDIAIPCGLLINELMSNALKHAFADATEGRLRVALHRNGDNNNVLIVADTGTEFPGGLDIRHTKSFGLQLVNTLVEQLNGEIALKTDRGTEFTVTFPDML